jgi:hypothetical protein
MAKVEAPLMDRLPLRLRAPRKDKNKNVIASKAKQFVPLVALCPGIASSQAPRNDIFGL